MTEIINGTLRPLGDRIVLKPLEWKPSEIVDVIRHGRPLRGEVVAIGPGCNPKRYAPDRSSFKYMKRFQPTVVKPGDVVELGGLSTFDGIGYQFEEVVIGTEVHLICTEKDVAGVCCD